MIPTSFKLVNRTYKVKKLGKELAEKKYGDCDKEKALIRVYPGSTKENTEHTFYHELVHALLWATTKPKLSDNEDFVDSLAAMIHQYEQTKKGEFK